MARNYRFIKRNKARCGSTYKYNVYGCRCPLCKYADRRAKEKRLPKMKCGTLEKYNIAGCRCPLCSKVRAAYDHKRLGPRRVALKIKQSIDFKLKELDMTKIQYRALCDLIEKLIEIRLTAMRLPYSSTTITVTEERAKKAKDETAIIVVNNITRVSAL